MLPLSVNALGLHAQHPSLCTYTGASVLRSESICFPRGAFGGTVRSLIFGLWNNNTKNSDRLWNELKPRIELRLGILRIGIWDGPIVMPGGGYGICRY